VELVNDDIGVELEIREMTSSTEDGLRLAAMIAAMRRLYVDVRGLLQTFEEMMGDVNWVQAADQTCIIDARATISSPFAWSPREVFRFLKNEEQPDRLVVACVLLENRIDREKDRGDFAEPLVATTWFDYAGQAVTGYGKNWHWWYSRFHTYLGSFEPELWIRRDVESFPEKERAEQKYEFKRLSSRVVPLSAVRDAEALRNLVVQPLLDDLALGRGGAETARAVQPRLPADVERGRTGGATTTSGRAALVGGRGAT
jgi:hypothetical protein